MVATARCARPRRHRHRRPQQLRRRGARLRRGEEAAKASSSWSARASSPPTASRRSPIRPTAPPTAGSAACSPTATAGAKKGECQFALRGYPRGQRRPDADRAAAATSSRRLSPSGSRALARAAPGRAFLGRRAPLSRRRAAPARPARRPRRAQVGAPLVAVNDVLYHAPERRPLADVAHLHPREMHDRTRPASGSRSTPSGISNRPPRWRGCSPASPTRSPAASRSPRPARSTRRAQLRISRRAGAARQDAAAASRRPDLGGRAPSAIRTACRTRCGSGSTRSSPSSPSSTTRATSSPSTTSSRFARSRPQEILCQGRGSAANSAVCYCLGITAVDPDKSNLLFERFISREPRRAARHRRRFRARAARGGDPVHLRALRPRARRDLRHRHPLSRRAAPSARSARRWA